MAEKNVAVFGVTGAVGQEFVKILEQRNFPCGQVKFFASGRSAGKKLTFRGQTHTIIKLDDNNLADIDLVLSSLPSAETKRFVPAAARAGAVVVDNSSAFRMDPDVPLVVPEINPQDIASHHGIIANPNCSTIIALVPLWPLHRENRIRRLVIATYQAVSGAGAAAMQELIDQTRDVLAGKKATPQAFANRIAFNLFPHDADLGENGYNKEEIKMVLETRKIFHEPQMMITATCVRVPVLRAHCEAINVEFENPMTPQRVQEILEAAPGVRVVHQPQQNYFPMPIDATDQDDVLVGRFRQDISRTDGRGIEFWIAGDQLRKGAALNAIQIAERVLEIEAARV